MSFVSNAQKSDAKFLTPVIDQLWAEYSEHLGNIANNQEYKDLFKQVIGRCVADTVGVVTGEHSENAPGAKLEEMYDNLIAAGYSKDDAKDVLLNNIAAYTQIYISTPHPTEFFSEKAIVCEDEVMKSLSQCREDLFNIGKGGEAKPKNLNPANKEKLFSAMDGLFGELTKPVAKSMVIEEEMYRGTWFSKRQAEAIPLVADGILSAIDGGINSKDLNFEQIKQYFGNIQRSGTWSPGDQDSKPDATVDMLEAGLGINKRAVLSRYFRSLVEIGSKLDPKTDSHAISDIRKTMYALAQTTCDTFEDAGIKVDHSTVTNMLLGQPLDGTKNPYQFDTKSKYEELAKGDFFKEFSNTLNTLKSPAYSDNDAFLSDVEKLRNNQTISDVTNGGRLSAIDSLLVTALNTKDSAQRIQVRQNASMHKKVVEYLIDLVPEDTISAEQKAAIKAAKDSGKVEEVIDKLLSGDDTKFAEQLSERVKDKLEEIKGKCGDKPVKKENIGKEINQQEFEFYQTMSTMGVAVENADRVPRYIIAECASSKDIMEAFLLAKVMEKVKGVENNPRKLEIVSLVEHPSLVTERQDGSIDAVDMNIGAMENKYFREHHLQNKSFDNLIKDYSLKDKEQKNMSVADAKRKFGYEVKQGDEDKKIEGTKMFMGAGSDVTKAGGAAAAAAMQDAMEKTREALLDQGIYMIDYLGTGGGVSRSNPSSNECSTVQGRSQKTTPAAYAQKTLDLVVRHLHEKLSHDPDVNLDEVGNKVLPFQRSMTSSDRSMIARSNLGNMYDLPSNSKLYQSETKPRTDAMIGKYNAMYESDEFHALMGYTANPFVGLTQYAARPLKRLGSSGGQEAVFPPEVKVKDLRAIGFAAALNAAGNTAPLFYGASEYLKEGVGEKKDQDNSQLRNMYLNDPKAQDTINRITYGVIMADMETQWKYLGLEEIPNQTALKALAETSTSNDSKTSALHALAKIQLEYDTVAKELVKLHSSMIGKPAPEITSSKQAADLILKSLPAALREQMEFDRNNIKESREKLSQLFQNISNKEEVSLDYITKGKMITDEELAVFKDFASSEGKKELSSDDIVHITDAFVGLDSSKSRKDITNRVIDFLEEVKDADGKYNLDYTSLERGKQVFNDVIYPSMGTAAYESFEHTLAAYSNPKLARDVEKRLNVGKVAA